MPHGRNSCVGTAAATRYLRKEGHMVEHITRPRCSSSPDDDDPASDQKMPGRQQHTVRQHHAEEWRGRHTFCSGSCQSCSSLKMEEHCFPQLLNTSCRKPTSPWANFVLLNIVLCFISLLTVALNLLVIISVSHFRQLHTPTNILLLSLAVSDFLVGLLALPGEVFRKTSCWFLGDLMCLLYYYVSVIIACSSIGNMVLISVDRYVAICDPLHYTTRVTVKRVKLCVCLCWLCVVSYSSLLLKDDLTQPGRYNSCHGECVIVINHIAGVVDLVVSVIVPISVIVVLYMRVFVVAVSQARAMRSHITAVTLQLSVNQQTKKSELKAARTLGVLVVVFLICFCPYYCVTLAGDALVSSSSASYLLYLFFLNSCLNPLIYALFYSWFRKAVKLIVSLQILQPGSCETNIL
ncbi:trace amine-associated receptor 8a-like [Epinephelus fuscoguttatus]|uniref:trace amine-associated receptor 8a-like n=1 Tax=Epinephelus fuscoguttatus TaxID=293821 RepID=UPI0020D0308D|nr:trace amine-associated receptor 8a-like [Epinephelus fuscoguttatus]